MVPARKLRILIAEDDEVMVDLYSGYASKRGHETIVAHDGAETLLVAATEMPDIILLDVAMPKLDGRDVCKQLKANAKTAPIPIIVVSALGGDQYMRDLLLELGAGDVVEKPVDLQITFNKIERLARK